MEYNQAVRYARNMCLPEIGKQGQDKLTNAKVLVVGAGGLGSPLLLYLTAAGIGNIGIIDHDQVELSNLQRQILFTTDDLGKEKVHCAKNRLLNLNPEVKITTYNYYLDKDNIMDVFQGYDIIADGSDNFTTRFLINAACYKYKKTLVSAAVQGFLGQLFCFKAYLGDEYPCYQCIYPNLPSDGEIPTCTQAGVIGSFVGQMGSWQATECIKEILNIGKSLAKKMMIVNGLTNNMRMIKVPCDPSCPICHANIFEKDI